MTQTAVKISPTENKWHSSPIISYQGSIEAIREHIPSFERRTFGLNLAKPIYRGEPTLFDSPEVPAGVNPCYDAIVRMPLKSEESTITETPIGIVSPQYTLLQHQTVIDEVIKAVGEQGVNDNEIEAKVELTHFGERMHLELIFPDKFNIKLKDNDEMSLRLECFNSVDGSTRFMAVIGWLRFVCSNGLVIGTVQTDYRRRHNQAMDISEIGAVLRDGITATTREKKIYKKWMKHTISSPDLLSWVDGFLAQQWGVKAAVRAWHITNSGYDVIIADPFEAGKPSEKTVIQIDPVPGAVIPGDTVFAVAQSLAWLAKERRDVQEQLLWKQQIPKLLQPLLRKKACNNT